MKDSAKGEKQKFAISKGWSTYYHEDYWVNPKVVTDPQRQNYTDYGRSLDGVLLYESRICNLTNEACVRQCFDVAEFAGNPVICKMTDQPNELP